MTICLDFLIGMAYLALCILYYIGEGKQVCSCRRLFTMAVGYPCISYTLGFANVRDARLFAIPLGISCPEAHRTFLYSS